jgi:hypothetical protein
MTEEEKNLLDIGYFNDHEVLCFSAKEMANL